MNVARGVRSGVCGMGLAVWAVAGWADTPAATGPQTLSPAEAQAVVQGCVAQSNTTETFARQPVKVTLVVDLAGGLRVDDVGPHTMAPAGVACFSEAARARTAGLATQSGLRPGTPLQVTFDPAPRGLEPIRLLVTVTKEERQAQHLAGVACHEAAYARNPVIGSKVVMELHVRPDGTTKKARVTKPAALDDKGRACFVRMAQTHRVPVHPDRPGPTTVSYVFAPPRSPK